MTLKLKIVASALEILTIGGLLRKILFSPPSLPCPKCGKQMEEGESVRQDTLRNGKAVAAVTTPLKCSNCGPQPPRVRYRPINRPADPTPQPLLLPEGEPA